MATKGQGSATTFQFGDPAVISGILAVILIMAWVAWQFAHEQISAVYVYVRYAQLWLLNFIGLWVDLPIISQATEWVQQACAPEDGWLLCTQDFATTGWGQIQNSTLVINSLFLVVMVALCFRMFFIVERTHPLNRYTKNHTIQSFMKENADLYPHLKLFSKIDLVSKPLDDPIFGMSLTSRQYAYKYKLISGWEQTGDGDFVPILNRSVTTTLLIKQLGKHWTRSADLTPGETLLLAIALPRVAATDPLMSDEKFKQALADSDDFIKWCWTQFEPTAPQNNEKKNTGKKVLAKGESSSTKGENEWLSPAIDLTRAKEIIARYIKHPAVVQIISRHAYRRTVLYACYTKAGSLGVFPSADVRWLRFFDRELWYLRSSMGRQVAFAEGGNAVYSHYLYEAKAGHPIVEPQLDKALNGLESAMHKFKYTEVEKAAYEKLP